MNRRSIASVAGACLVSSLLAGGIAWAAIPGGGGVINACYGKVGGVVRVIDPAKNQKCLPNLELPLTWNQTGPTGATGAPGVAGPAGPAGASPTVAQLDRGDANCPSGGAAIADASGSVAYVCNGTEGASFDGSFTSPNGQYSIAVSDAGIMLTDTNGGSVTLAGGAIEVSGNSLFAQSATNTTITSGSTTSLTSGLDTQVVTGRDMSVTTGRDVDSATAGTMQTSVEGAVSAVYGRSFDVRIGGDSTVSTDGSAVTSTGGDAATTIGGDMSLTTGRSIAVSSGGAVTAQAATSTNIGTGTTFTVDAGGNALVQSSAGVTIRASGELRLMGSRIFQN